MNAKFKRKFKETLISFSFVPTYAKYEGAMAKNSLSKSTKLWSIRDAYSHVLPSRPTEGMQSVSLQSRRCKLDRATTATVVSEDQSVRSTHFFCFILIWPQSIAELSHYGSGQTVRVQESWGFQNFSTFDRLSTGKVFSHTHRPPLPPGDILGTHFC
jgi:hypothetical protein